MADEATTTDEQTTTEASERTYTHSQLEKILGERLAREREKAADPNSRVVRKDHYESLMQKAAQFDELEAANKSELEKANERAAKLEREAEQAKIRAQEITLRSSIVAEAARRQLIDPDAAVAMLDRSVLDFDDEGAPTNIAEAMDVLVKAKPYLAGGARGSSADQGARAGSNGAGDMNQLLRQAAGHTL